MGVTQSDIVVTAFAVTLVLLILASFGIIFTLIHKKKQQANKKERQLMQSEFNHAILQTQVEIQEQTLNNISQEIHDNIGQVLSLVKLNLNSLVPTTEDRVQDKIIETRQLITKVLLDLRDLSRSLHGDKIAELGLSVAIAAELKILQNTGHFTTSLAVTGAVYKLEPKQEMVIFRIVQEAMNNAIKHSGGRHIGVSIHYSPELFTLSVQDNGIGFNPANLSVADSGIGLKNMQNRAALVKAHFFISSPAGGGTQVNINIPRFPVKNVSTT